ncbi:MAG TPA: hypothetical protein VK387_05465 [Thermoleophilaceae bacterium]|nr:hypothetical protein [Thermoleophilaceae bacterium]
MPGQCADDHERKPFGLLRTGYQSTDSIERTRMKIADILIRIITFGRFRARQRPKVLRMSGERSRSARIRRRSRLARALR